MRGESPDRGVSSPRAGVPGEPGEPKPPLVFRESDGMRVRASGGMLNVGPAICWKDSRSATAACRALVEACGGTADGPAEA